LMLMKPMTVQRNAKIRKNLFVFVDDGKDDEGEEEDDSFRLLLDIGAGEVREPEDGGEEGLEFGIVY